MKTVALLLITVITANLFGNEKKDSLAGRYRKIQVGVNFSSDYCYRTLKNNDGSSTSDLVMRLRNESEMGKFGYTTGLNVIFNLNKNIGIGTGLQYSLKGYQTKMQELNFGDPIDPLRNPAGTPFPLLVKGKTLYTYYYFDVPLSVNLTIGNGVIRFITSTGISTNFFRKETSTLFLEYDDGKNTKETNPTTFDYNKINISPFISLGIEWKINSRNSLRVEPTFRYGVLKIIDEPLTGYLWNSGLNISYYFGFN